MWIKRRVKLFARHSRCSQDAHVKILIKNNVLVFQVTSIAQGLGMALMEEYIPQKTEDLHNYLIPTVGDMPEIHSILIEKTDPEGPMGAKGLGEHVLIPTAPAILNAIRHATGARLTRVPALPHRVRAAIQKAEDHHA